MASDAQNNANRANAQKSTGPRTIEGKNIARFNATRHGITGQIFALIPADEKKFNALEEGFMRSLKPVTEFEISLVASIARDSWRINGASANENNMTAFVQDEKFGQHTIADSPETQAAATRARVWLDEEGFFYANIPLYQKRIHSIIEKNLDRLKNTKAERVAAEEKALEEAELLLKLAAAKNELLDTKQLTKEIGSVFSTPELRARLNHKLALEEAAYYQKHNWKPEKPWSGAKIQLPPIA